MEPSTEQEYKTRRETMVANQIVSRGITDRRLLRAMRTLPRHLFIPPAYRVHAYSDHPVPIGEGQTISQPYMVAYMTSLLELQGGEKVLEIGTGSGYQSGILGLLAREVHTVEFIPELAEQARRNLTEAGIHNVAVHVADGSLGWPNAAPYDGVIVTAAAPATPPPLLDQLCATGRLVIPVGKQGIQEILLWEKKEGEWCSQSLMMVAFVPLRGKWGWSKEEWLF